MQRRRGCAFAWLVTPLIACGFRQGSSPISASDAYVGPDAPLTADASLSCLQRWAVGDVAFSTPAPVSEINSIYYDRDPFVTVDDLTIYWSSTRNSVGLGSDLLFMATRASESATFGGITQVNVMPMGNVEKFSLTEDGEDALFAADNGGPNIQVWEATRAGSSGAFAAASQANEGPLDAGNLTPNFDPLISTDGLAMIYAPSAMTGATRVQQLMMSSRTSRTASFGAPTGTAVAALYSGQGEADPTLSPDGLLIVFTSNRPATFKGTNLWYATRANDTEPFGTPQLVPDVNTDADEGDGQLSGDGCRVYYATDANLATSNWDIYVAEMTP